MKLRSVSRSFNVSGPIMAYPIGRLFKLFTVAFTNPWRSPLMWPPMGHLWGS